jgi:mRNA interferase MazF
MAAKKYIPDRGDIVWLQFTPQAGHEQAGHRPTLVLSPASYNRRSGLMLCCPITSRVKGYPFEVALGEEQDSAGVVLADQIKSLDWKARQATKKGKASAQVMAEALSKLHTLL